MTTYVYVAAQDDNKVSVFTMDAGTGKLTPKAEVPISDGHTCWRSAQTGRLFTSDNAAFQEYPVGV